MKQQTMQQTQQTQPALPALRRVSWFGAGAGGLAGGLKKRFIGSAFIVLATVGTAVAEDLLPVPVFPLPVPILVNEALVNEALVNEAEFDFQNGVIIDDGEMSLVGKIGQLPDIPPPHAPAQPSAIIVRWDNYRTLIVIDGSAGLMKSCWIVTLAVTPEQFPAIAGNPVVARNQVVVSYRGQAYLDKDKVLHIDARRARIGGALAQGWSPDSFSISPDKNVITTDDRGNPSNSGEVEKIVPADTQAGEYRKLMFTAQSIIEGNI
jgi:hypothetical protein